MSDHFEHWVSIRAISSIKFTISFRSEQKSSNCFSSISISILGERVNFRAIRAKFRAILCLVSTLNWTCLPHIISNLFFYICSFNFPTSATSSTTTGTTWTHLADQHYDICIRRASGYCYICYSALQTTAPASFGLS